MRFVPKQVYFEPAALDYPLGQEILHKVKELGITVRYTTSHNRITGLTGKTAAQAYLEAKQTLVVGVRKGLDFASCKPSAHYQLPLATSCPSMCEYCYLATTLGKRPYLRVYVNLDEILNQAKLYIHERSPEITYFEGSAVSDPIPTEYLTGILAKTITFFGETDLGRFRFVTKHQEVDSLLSLPHNQHTRFRFSLNADAMIARYEHRTPTLKERIKAAGKVLKAGYPVGFIIAPIFTYPNWQNDYEKIFIDLQQELMPQDGHELTFEFITHRFTKRAKNRILEVFPQTELPMEEAERKFKFGQFGYGKYVYQVEQMEAIKEFMFNQVKRYFPAAETAYFV